MMDRGSTEIGGLGELEDGATDDGALKVHAYREGDGWIGIKARH